MICQICGNESREVLVKERNVSCGDYFEGARIFKEDAGEISLLECVKCGFGVFAEMHGWSSKTYVEKIYNDDYHLCDPPFREDRPRKLAHWLRMRLAPCDLIDFGGGDGRLAELLSMAGFCAQSCDPFYGNPQSPNGKGDVVTAFEVIEHAPDQRTLFHSLRDLCRPGGLIIFSTLLKERSLSQDWWYASPRNGHVAFHTAESLALLMSQVNLAYVALSRELHAVAFDHNDLTIAKGWPAITINDHPGFQFSEHWTKMAPVSP